MNIPNIHNHQRQSPVLIMLLHNSLGHINVKRYIIKTFIVSMYVLRINVDMRETRCLLKMMFNTLLFVFPAPCFPFLPMPFCEAQARVRQGKARDGP